MSEQDTCEFCGSGIGNGITQTARVDGDYDMIRLCSDECADQTRGNELVRNQESGLVVLVSD